MVALFDRNKDIQVYRQNLAEEKKKLDAFKETLKYHFVSSLVGGKDKYEVDDMMKLSKYILTLLIVLAVIAAFSGCEAKPSDDPDLTENKTTDVSHLTTVQNNTDLSRLQKPFSITTNRLVLPISVMSAMRRMSRRFTVF